MKSKEQKSKIKYNFEDDIFSALPIYRKYDSSFQIENLIFDIDQKGKINGFEIINASKLFHIQKAFLKNMVRGKLEIEVNEGFIKINMLIECSVRNSSKTSTVNIERIRPDFLKPSHMSLAVS